MKISIYHQAKPMKLTAYAKHIHISSSCMDKMPDTDAQTITITKNSNNTEIRSGYLAPVATGRALP